MVLGGSRSIDTQLVRTELCRLLLSLPASSLILLRLGANIGPYPFEQLAWIEATRMGFEVEWRVPEIGRGRGGVFERNIAMVAEADLVVAIFPAGQEMQGGTAHLIEKAIDQNCRALAFSLDGTQLKRIGDHAQQPIHS